MIILILVLCIIFAIIFKDKTSIAATCEILITFMFVSIAIIVPDVAASSTIDNNIAMYQEENAAIEQSIDKIVEEYLKQNPDALTALEAEKDSITLITLIPKLQSNTFIQKQLDTYSNNTRQIHWLRDEKFDISKKKWLLYFGK